MSMRHSASRKPDAVRLWTRPATLVWSAILLSALICGAVSWIHVQQRQTLERATRLLENFRQSRVDLAKGFLHYTLAGGPASPFSREQGLALLEQAITALETALHRSDIDEHLHPEEAEALQAFERSAETFRTCLTEWRQSPAGPAEAATRLRIAFSDLEHQAERIDDASRADLERLIQRLDAKFALTLAAAALLLAGVCGAVFFAERARNKSVAALHESEERLRLAQTAAGIGTWDVDLIRDHATWSEQEEALFGFAPGTYDHTSATFWNLIHPEDRERVRQAAEKAGADGGEFDAEYRIHRHGDHALRWIAVHGRAVHDGAGRPIRMLGVNLDITEQKRAAAVLANEVNMRRTIFAQSPDGILIIDPETARPIEFNDTAHQQLGYSREEFARLSIFDLEAEETPEDTRERIRTVLRDGSCDFETRQRTRQGEIRNVHVTAQIITIHDRSVYHCVWRDITERKRSEEALRTSEERLTRILETVPDGIALVNREGRITYANPGAERLLGLTRRGITDRTYNDPAWHITTVDGRPFPDDEQPFTRVMRTGEPMGDIEQVIEHPDGRRVILSVSAAPLRDASGTMTGMVAAFTDITGRKLAEYTLRDSEERYRSLFTAMQEGFALHEIICDAAGRPQDYRYLEVNAAFERSTGIPRERWIGHTVREVLPRIEEYWIAGYGEVALTGVARKFENYVKELDRHYEVVAYSPKRGQFAIMALDVTERRRAEEALRQKTEELDRYFSTALDLFCIADIEGRFRRLNKQWEKILGYPLAELEGKSFLDFVHPADRVATEQNNQLAKRGQILNFVNRYRRKDGEYCWIEWSSHPSGNLIFAAARDITERKRAEEELALNQERYRRAIAAANAIPYQKNYASDTYVFMGEGIKDITGYAPEELRSAVWRAMILETVFLGEAAGLDRAEAARRAITGEIKHWRADHCIRTRNGDLRWISDSSIALFDETGRYVGSMGIIQDVTERKQAEEAVRRSEASLALAQRVAHLGSWEIDLASHSLTWSDETYRIFGVSPGAFCLTRETFLQLVHPEDRAVVQAAVLEATRTAQPYVCDHRIRRPDGSERIVSERADVLTDPTGVPIRLVGTVQDVTELKRAEQALLRSEKHFRSIIDTVQDLISIVDVSGVIRFASPSAKRALGYTPEQLLDHNAFDFIPPDEHAAVQAALVRALGESHQPVAVQHHFQHADGSVRMLESIGNRLESEAAQALVVNSRDITERRRLEEQLRQSQKMEAIGQLAAGVAHDFNNLLTIIQGNASLLLGTSTLSKEDAISMAQVIEAAERAAGLTRQLLMFSRKQLMRLANLDVNEVVGNMTKMLQRILGEDVALRSEYSPNLPLVQADAGMLEQVLLNLAVNARDAMPTGGQLVIRTSAMTLRAQDLEQRPGATAAQHICLEVTDTGCGIAPENLSRIFDPFFTTKEVGKGTGLGLATVYGIVKQHRGWIEVASEVGKGTTFHIYLPAVEGSAATQRTGSELRELPRGTEVILVVEDEPAVRLLVNNLLQRCGYTVLLAESGVAALDVWKEHKNRIALLLTDMVMPDGVSGLELASRLRAECPELKVIYSSGYSATVGGTGPALVEGVNFLQKPYPPHYLAKTVRACLDRSQV